MLTAAPGLIVNCADVRKNDEVLGTKWKSLVLSSAVWSGPLEIWPVCLQLIRRQGDTIKDVSPCCLHLSYRLFSSAFNLIYGSSGLLSLPSLVWGSFWHFHCLYSPQEPPFAADPDHTRWSPRRRAHVIIIPRNICRVERIVTTANTPVSH